ncbi:MAG: hypothetical protein IJW06_05120 [Clostridia bacterium]|nr:hypothetical protein [Clostridia bacterium]
MKKTNFLLIISASILAVFLFCSCSRSSMNRTGNSIRNATRRAENYMDNGLNAVENGVENGSNTIIGGAYGANSGYSGNAGIGSSTGIGYGTGTGAAVARSGKASPLLPTLGDKSRDNKGQINTNNGSLDGGMGDIYDDTNMKRNSLRRDMIS